MSTRNLTRGTYLFGLLALWAPATGCLKLDPFLYTPERLERYVLDPQGESPEETVTVDRIEPLFIDVEPDVRLGAVYVRAAAQPPRATVLYFHGRGGHLDEHFNRSKRLSNLGYDVLTIDYRGWGMSSNVTPTEEGIAKDGKAARAYLQTRVSNPARIVYYGHSFGTAVLAQLAVTWPASAIIMESGFASIEAFKDDSSQMDFPVGFVAKDSWNTEERVRQIQTAVLFLHGTKDDFVRKEFSQKLHDAAAGPKELLFVEGAGHVNIPSVMGSRFADVIRGFVEAHVP